MRDQADFDLERFIDMFDQALTSDDPRVIDALRSLMMMVILTKPETNEGSFGPLRRMFDDHRNIMRRLTDLEERDSYRYRREMEQQWGTKTVESWKIADRKWDKFADFTIKEEEYNTLLEAMKGQVNKLK